MNIPQQQHIPHGLIIWKGVIYADEYNDRIIQLININSRLVGDRSSIKWTKEIPIKINGVVQEKTIIFYEIVLHWVNDKDELPSLGHVFIYPTWSVKKEVREILKWLEVSNNDEKELILSALSE